MNDPSIITCALTIEWLNKQKSVEKTGKWNSAELSLLRNEFREIFLQAKVKTATFKFRLENINVHKKFLSEGKATIHLYAHPAILYVSNAPASELLLFLKTMFIKMSSSKSSPKVPLRQQLVSNKNRTVQEISPINAKDMTRTVGASADILKSAALQKRKTVNDKNQVVKKQCVESLLKEKLNEEQKNVLEAVKSGLNIFFTGSAGTGKSFLLRHIIAALPPVKTIVTASTGAAAALIQGTTLHNFAGIGDGGATMERCLQLARRPQVLSNWKRCSHLIIDEISMVDGSYFEKVEKVARIVKSCDKPFGGIQLIVCGDFLQLPPVVSRNTPHTHKFCFQFAVWNKCQFTSHHLVKVHRQSDPTFIDLLNNIRIGKVTKEMTECLTRTASRLPAQGDIVATKLCSHNSEAAAINNFELNKLPGPERKFVAEDSNPGVSKLLDDQTPVESTLILKDKAQVMLLKNINIGKGLVNGARGVITKFSKEGYPVVRFMTNLEVVIQREKWLSKSAGGTIFSRKQIPLKLAWAFSIHKSQGLTLDCVEISLSKVFESGQAYVALSRAKSLQSLRIVDFDPKQVWADPEVLKFYKKELFNSKLREYIPLGKR